LIAVIHKGVDLTGLLGGGIKRLEVWGSLSFFVKLPIIFALKYNKQQLLLLLDKINLAAKYTFKIYFSLSTFKH